MASPWRRPALWAGDCSATVSTTIALPWAVFAFDGFVTAQAVIDAGNFARAQVPAQNLLHRVGVESESDALGAVTDGGVDADQLAVDIQQRAA